MENEKAERLEVEWPKKGWPMGSLFMYMSDLEIKAGPLTLTCIAYRAAKWKYNMIIPPHIDEPSAYSDDIKVKSIAQIYDKAKEQGYTGHRYFVKHGLWRDLRKFYNIKHFIGLRNEEKCFVCYLIKNKYPYIERDPPHDIKVDKACRLFNSSLW